jgi:hypothetical protein
MVIVWWLGGLSCLRLSPILLFIFYFLAFRTDFGLDFFESQWIDKDSPAIMTNKLHSLYGDDPLHDPFVSLHNTFARRLYGVEWSGVECEVRINCG